MSGKIIVIGGKSKGAKFSFTDSPLTLGTDSSCDIKLIDAGILDRHAVIEKERGSWRLRALDAAQPIEFEGRALMEICLTHGSTFRLGETLLRFATPQATIDAASFAGKPFENSEKAVEDFNLAKERIMAEVGKIIIGQQEVITQILTAFFARGHCLLIGVPGLAKTLMVRAIAGTLDLDSKRIQFTPDLMPADITGTDIIEEDTATGRRRFRFNKGPLFTNILLADEINRTPPKTQAALLEAMQERQITASGITYELPNPFLTLATQNPIELEGTYPLPEAQLDRFMFSIHIDYPTDEEEPEIINETTRDRPLTVDRILDAETILKFQHLVRQVPVSRHVALYASSLARATRPGMKDSLDFISRWVRWGAGPRAGQYLLLAAKAYVLFNDNFNVSCADVKKYALPVLRHRIFRNFSAVSEGISTDDIVSRILEYVKEPEY